MPGFWQGLIGFGLGAGAIAYLGICLFLRAYQTRFIFFPKAEILLAPAAIGAEFEEVRLSVPGAPEAQIYGWWLPARAPEATILFFHGNSSNISSNLEAAARFVSWGFNVFLFDYRGYGKSRGEFPNEARVYEDARLALDYLLEERAIAPESIILYGHSLGGAIAIDLATQNPQLGALIVEGSFTSIREMVDCTGIYSLFPIDLLLDQHFNSQQKVPSLKMPVLYLHGTADPTVPHEMSQTLFERTRSPKSLLIVPGAHHNNVAEVAGETYEQAVRELSSDWRARRSEGATY